jgi:hypothetical protein
MFRLPLGLATVVWCAFLASATACYCASASPVESSLSLWLDAADPATLSISDDGMVSSVLDKSPFHAISVAGTAQYHATSLNGRPALSFLGYAGIQFARQPQYLMPSNIDFFAVAQFSGTSPQGIICMGSGAGYASGDNYLVDYAYPGSSSLGAESSSATDWGWVGSNPNVISPGQPVIIEVSYDGARLDGQWRFYVNGKCVGQANNQNNYTELFTTGSYPYSLYIGRQGLYNPMDAGSLLSEVLLYKGTLDESSRLANTEYLAEKYGIVTEVSTPVRMESMGRLKARYR